ncbi:MAG: SUMF1/EgtB/PvdO family nonheme iron enzyme [Thermodesulfovibrionales bacterium]
MKSIKNITVICLLSVSLFFCVPGSTKSEAVSISDVIGDMVAVQEGWFTMGLQNGEFNERPEHEVYLDSYKIDRYEVSAKDFAAFLIARGNPENRYFTAEDSSTVEVGHQGYAAKQGYEDFPANNVSWFGAMEYCRWKGKRLPTEAEWEKAARGDDRRIYPWGYGFPTENRARYARDFGESGVKVMVSVDALPAGESFYGAKNMAGNVVEWTYDWYRQNFCDFCDPSGEEYLTYASEIICGDKTSVEHGKKVSDVPPRNNPEGPSLGVFKVLRGGSWHDLSVQKIRSTYRIWLDPLERFPYTGFRCVSTDAKAVKDEKTSVADIICKPKTAAVEKP